MIVSKVYNSILFTFDSVGDVHEYNIEVPLRGWDELSSLSVAGTGITGSRYCDLLVSYTFDGINYSEFAPLSVSIMAPIRSDFIVKVRMVRAGGDNTGQIVINSLTLNGDYLQSYYDVWDLSGTIFAGIIYEDERWNRLWINLLQKVYQKGIVPEFLVRGADIYPADQTYIEFWKYQCMFWALIVELGFRKIEGLTEDRADLLDFLRQKTLFFCEDEVTLEQLQYVAQNVWDEIRQRGTHMIHYAANVPLGGGMPTYIIPADIEKQIDGELLRYLCYDVLKEHVFAYYSRHWSGWNLDNTFINQYAYRSQIQLNKSPENTQDLLLDNYTVYNPVDTFQDVLKDRLILTEDDLFFLVTEDDNPIVIDGPVYGVAYLSASNAASTDLYLLETSSGGDFYVLEDAAGYLALETNDFVADLGIVGNGFKFGAVVDAKLGYLCSMWIYGLAPINSSTSIWVKAFKDGGTTQIPLLRADGSISVTLEANVLFNDGPIQQNKWWYFEFFIDPVFDSVATSDATTNWGVGSSLKFYDNDTDKVEIFVLNQGDQDFLVWDVKFRPMKFDNTDNLDNYNQTILISHLNNPQVTEEQFVDDVVSYLLPYGSGFYFKNLAKWPDTFNLLTELEEPITTENDLNILV